MANLNKTDFQLKFKQGLATDINTSVTKEFAVEGEPHWTTDTDTLYIFNGSNNTRVHGLDLVVMFEDNIISYLGEIVWLT